MPPIVQFHILQQYPPHEMNRNRDGRPKSTWLGKSPRGRISSQCLKRALRMEDHLVRLVADSPEYREYRTIRLPALIGAELQTLKATQEEIDSILPRVGELGRKVEEPAEDSPEDPEEEGIDYTDRTGQLVFVAHNEVKSLAAQLLTLCRDTSKPWAERNLEKSLQDTHPKSLMIALFGRFVTSDVFHDIPSAIQAAHALTTHEMIGQRDFFTGVDDLEQKGRSRMIGTRFYHAGCYYRYLNVSPAQLLKNLDGDRALATAALRALPAALFFAHPSGSQNAYAAFTPPDWMLAEVRSAPLSYTNAFRSGIGDSENGDLLSLSASALSSHIVRMDTVTGERPARALLSTDPQLPVMDGVDPAATLAELGEWAAKWLPQ